MQDEELSKLNYEEHGVPLWVWLPWIALGAFGIYYLIHYSFPDLKNWM